MIWDTIIWKICLFVTSVRYGYMIILQLCDGWRLSCLADMSRDEIRFVERYIPWWPRITCCLPWHACKHIRKHRHTHIDRHNQTRTQTHMHTHTHAHTPKLYRLFSYIVQSLIIKDQSIIFTLQMYACFINNILISYSLLTVITFT